MGVPTVIDFEFPKRQRFRTLPTVKTWELSPLSGDWMGYVGYAMVKLWMFRVPPSWKRDSKHHGYLLSNPMKMVDEDHLLPHVMTMVQLFHLILNGCTILRCFLGFRMTQLISYRCLHLCGAMLHGNDIRHVLDVLDVRFLMLLAQSPSSFKGNHENHSSIYYSAILPIVQPCCKHQKWPPSAPFLTPHPPPVPGSSHLLPASKMLEAKRVALRWAIMSCSCGNPGTALWCVIGGQIVAELLGFKNPQMDCFWMALF